MVYDKMEMMTQELLLLAGTAAVIGLVHTLLGPDHYLPFIVISKSGQWSLKKTATVTLLCGVGHVLGSVALGLAGDRLGRCRDQPGGHRTRTRPVGRLGAHCLR